MKALSILEIGTLCGCLLVVAGCGSADSGVDAASGTGDAMTGPVVDGGSATVDGSVTESDGGAGAVDGGAAMDAGGTTIDAGGTTIDAGGTTIDAGGTTIDAGGTTIDAGGTTIDAGGTTIDAGGTTIDAGATTADAGATTADAGATTADAGATTADAGGGPPDSGGGSPDATPNDGEPPSLMGITAAHNQVRATVSVAPLTWDPALAVIAQGWADQCVDVAAPSGLIDHNQNRSDTYPGYVGENVYGSSGTATAQGAVSLWAAEEQWYDYATNTCAPGKVCGHYTQIVWANTAKVGCGISTCPNLTYRSSIVCNYAPGGNYSGQWPY